jgi:hypothetical protein
MRSTFTTWRASTMPFTHIANEASTMIAASSTRKPGRSSESIGPGVRPCSISAPSSMTAGGLPGMPSVTMGMSAPPMQALLAVSAEIRPAGSPLPKRSGCFEPPLAVP